MLSTVVARKSTGEWVCPKLMAWLRELGLEFVDIIVKADSEPALKSGPKMITENSLVGSSKSNGAVERAIQSVQGMIRTICSAIEETWEVKIDATHSVWPWIAEEAGFLLTCFDVGRDGRTAYPVLPKASI